MFTKITAELLDNVSNKINDMRQASLALELDEKLKKVSNRITTGVTELQKLLWGEHYHLKDIIPAEWCDSLNSMKKIRYNCSVRIELIHDTNAYEDVKSLYMDYAGEENLLIPPLQVQGLLGLMQVGDAGGDRGLAEGKGKLGRNSVQRREHR